MTDARETPFATAWTPDERESFLAAIARHRRAAWQVSAVAFACIGLLALILALLTAPLFYALIGLLLDLVNLVTPMPDLLGSVMKSLGEISDSPHPVPLSRWISIAFWAALPGLCVFAAFAHSLRRLVREAETGSISHLSLRPPDASVLSEQRLGNVVTEMALAANVPVPRILIATHEAADAAVFGAIEAQATIIATTGLLNRLDRSDLQGAAGHLVGLLANGDVPQGLRIAQSLSLFGFVARLSDGIVDPPNWRRLWALLRQALRRGATSADAELILELTNPFGGGQRPSPAPEPTPSGKSLTWREWVRMPLFGPLVVSGFFGGLVSLAVLQPLIALAWRRRKYMADAIALQFTRDPDSIAGALQKLGGAPSGALPAWSAHMSIIQHGTARGMFSGLPMFPSLERRLKALGRMGADVRVGAPKQVPGWIWFGGVPLALVVAGLLGTAIVLLVFVSVALSGLFTWLPAMLLHFLLRM